MSVDCPLDDIFSVTHSTSAGGPVMGLFTGNEAREWSQVGIGLPAVVLMHMVTPLSAGSFTYCCSPSICLMLMDIHRQRFFLETGCPHGRVSLSDLCRIQGWY